MKHLKAAPAALSRPPTHEGTHPSADAVLAELEALRLQSLRAGITAAESAALLILMGNELARLAEAGESWGDEALAAFIAAGHVGLSQRYARDLRQTTNLER